MFWQNRYLRKAYCVAGLVIVMFAVGVVLNVLLCVSPLSVAFGLVKLDAAQWAIAVGAALSVIPLGEIYKLVLRSCTRRKPRCLSHIAGVKAKI